MNGERGRRTVVLVGMMGTGKSSVAKIVGDELGLEVFDTDRMVEAASGKKVRQMFDEEGEEHFRRIEGDQLERCLAGPAPCVVAAAGGVVLSEKNRAALTRASGRGDAVVVWLTAGISTLVARTRRGGHRPLLDEDPETVLREMARVRHPLYEAVSDAVIDTTGLTAREVAARVIEECAGR